MSKQKLPKGLTEESIRAIAKHYESQSDSDAEAEVEAAFHDRRYSMVQVPVEHLEQVRKIIATRPSGPKQPGVVKETKGEYGSRKKS